jgi:hypothetical protein
MAGYLVMETQKKVGPFQTKWLDLQCEFTTQYHVHLQKDGGREDLKPGFLSPNIEKALHWSRLK